ncbi:uncharacterized protein MELLADRAFT_87246 [Melampsora larici-populina 98AG31]|uniref:Uncharacterized protein n=1 Tax=Melampsora larici-populina (strain 98AG31 / pathotype 3-4-7) TaxID=747676 RepID=F4SDQ6_MELLP|nr:uncharacterized protein MELLADRAFT_87246 [Melampsora larici-populina 98AG31]EGF97216.1 hypothetical protein MELLADRAFT_87246 [Melampsora larici-populina 98AG31]
MPGKSKKKSPTTTSPQGSNPNQPATSDAKAPPLPSEINPVPNPSHISVEYPHGDTLNSTYFKIQTLPDNLRHFLEHDFEEKKERYKNIDYYRILVHFNPATESRPTSRKDKLIDAFMKDVFPFLKPYRAPAPPQPMQTDRKDFNPLSRRVKRQELIDVILETDRKVIIPNGVTNDGLLLLYKQHVDKDLNIPWQVEYIKPPNIVQRPQVKTLLMEELRLTLQDRAPHVYVHSTPMSHAVLVNLYIKFVLDEEVAPGLLVRGFHYSLLRKDPW